MKIAEFQNICGVVPAITFERFHRRLPECGFDPLAVPDEKLCAMLHALTAKAFPSEQDGDKTVWEFFYIPMRRNRSAIVVPMTVYQEGRQYTLTFPDKAPIEVTEGSQTHPLLQSLIRETLGFADIVKRHPDMIEQCLPYDFRTGRVRGRYILDTILPNISKHAIKRQYSEHLSKNLTCDRLSLNEYLDFAALCYQAAFQWKTDGLTPEQMYRTWADGRDCGMLDIPDRTSPELFRRWVQDHEDCGGHPFEIVRAIDGLGIHLIPFRFDDRCLTLLVSSDSLAWLYLNMVEGMIRAEVPFHASRDLDRMLEYLSGDEYFMVNTAGRHWVRCNWHNRMLWRDVQWDPPKMLYYV